MKPPFKGAIPLPEDVLCWEFQPDPITEWIQSLYSATSEREKAKSCFVINKYPKRLAAISPISAVRPTPEQEQEFRRLVVQWRREVMHLSSTTARVSHPAYKKITQMGRDVVPLLLRELLERGGHWFSALEAITKDDPVKPEDSGNVPKMSKAWIEWGRERGYLE